MIISTNLQWNPAADQAFKCLKAVFISGPILKHPASKHPSKPFIVEVDTSETGIGAVLSNWFVKKPKLHQVALL